MERLDELIDRRAQLVNWAEVVNETMKSGQPYIPAAGQAMLVEMWKEIVRVDLEVLDIHDAEHEALKMSALKYCVTPRGSTTELGEDEFPF